MIMNENVHFKEIAELLESGKVADSIHDSARKAFSLLGGISTSQKSEISDLDRWSRMYRVRHKTLLQKHRDCGGFEETLLALEAQDGPVDLILLESVPYVSMFLLDRNANNLIGAIYVERDPDTILS